MDKKAMKMEYLKKAQSHITDAWLMLKLAHPQIDSSKLCEMRRKCNDMELELDAIMEELIMTPYSEL